MRRHLCLALGLIAGACVPAKAKVSTEPTPTAAAVCGRHDPPEPIYVIDGKPMTCIAAMSISPSRIATVEVLKGAAAVSQYGASATGGVIVIQTKRNR
jgi:TonB-dependent SusC/RagA subfamily outer membrane receptor